jgi:hypothetical protein
MRGWFLIFCEVGGRSIIGDLDVGKERSKQTIVTLQSLHHGSVGYQHVRT